jgi:hypothetical protein
MVVVKDEEGFNAGLLCKMSDQERNEERQGYHDEEWKTGNPGCLPRMWNQDV